MAMLPKGDRMKLKQSDLKVGVKVRYQPSHYGDAFENGIVKKISTFPNDAIWVVYNCAGNWRRYRNYTGALTYLCDLKLGWG